MPVKKFKDPFQKDPPPQATAKSLKIDLKASEAPKAATKEPPSRLLTNVDGTRGRKTLLRDKWGNITSRVLEWLDGQDEKTGRPRLELLLGASKLKDIAVFAGIGTEKVLLLEGQPTSIVGQAESQKIQELIPALLQEAKRRGSTVELTERKAVITTNDPAP